MYVYVAGGGIGGTNYLISRLSLESWGGVDSYPAGGLNGGIDDHPDAAN